jgi:putative DNA methylase
MKKLIEVALPLEAINIASAREKSIRHGHPSTLHLWWARRPLAAARAVIFSQMVDDPSEYVDELLADPATRKKAETAFRKQLKAWEERKVLFDKADAAGMTASANPDPGNKPTLEGVTAGLERERLFRIIEDLVLWENTANEIVLQKARDEIKRSWRRTCAQNADHPRAKELFDPEKLPAFHDPFAGGGALPLEAQRLGLESYASDLNPVAVLINKAMIEIPPKFAGMPPVNPAARAEMQLMKREWKGAQGLAEDVRYYGKWMRDEAEKRIGHLYPKVEVTAEMAKERPDLKKYVGEKLTVIAWLWARTVKCPNPACSCDMPLISSLVLSAKPGHEWYLKPITIEKNISFDVQSTIPTNIPDPKKGYKRGVSGIFECVFCGTVTTRDYVAQQANELGLGSIQTAVVAEGKNSRVYLPAKVSPIPENIPSVNLSGLDVELAANPRDVWCRNFGLLTPKDLFTSRQLVALTTFSDLVLEVFEIIKKDAVSANLNHDEKKLNEGGFGAIAYADAVSVYLAFAVDKGANYWSSLCAWHQTRDGIVSTFGRQVLPMVWDFAEANPFSGSSGNWDLGIEQSSKMLMALGFWMQGIVEQSDAQRQNISTFKVVSTDPPYYDNIGYADLSDFFYVWLRRSLKTTFPELFATLAVPKAEELIATPYRHTSKQKAESFFLIGMTQTMHHLAEQVHSAFPITIYYAFKQSESNGVDGTASTGWETFLDAVIRAGFILTGTWPVRTEYTGNLKKNVSALASSIVLVCRKRMFDAPTVTRRDFVNALKAELPIALSHLQAGNIAPVDLAQAAIGPGMGIYTRYAKVLDAQGHPLSVRDALMLINQTLDEALAEQEGDFDSDTRWALAWFEQSGFDENEYGVAETLSKAKDTSVSGMVEAGILASGRGKVRLLKPAELPADWDPSTDSRLTTWEMVHQLIRVLESDGESAAAALVAQLGAQAETARELCYRLYTICERKKRNTEALSYNGLVQSWPEITRLAREGFTPSETQASFL